MQPFEMTLRALSDAIAARELSPVEVVDSTLTRIEAVEPQIGAFACVIADRAREQARVAEKEIQSGQHRGPLHGIPVAIKDLVNVAGVTATSSSRVRESFVPDSDAALVKSLRAAGAITVGKTHTHEFAYGVLTPTTGNPWDPTKTPGGSSGGTGAALAYGGVHVGIGTDTGGSIRIPGSVCGTVGLKPTFGRVSRYGVASLSWSLDHVGPMTRNIWDAAVMMNAITGHDPRDPGSAKIAAEDFTRTLLKGVKGLRIGVPTNWYTVDIDPEVEAAVTTAVAELKALGAVTRPVEIPLVEKLVSMEWGILMAEASAYHRRALRDTPELFNDDVRGLLEQGETILAADYIDALRLRQMLKRAWAEMARDVDVVIAPSTFAPALPRESPIFQHADGREEDAISGYVRMSLPMNLTGLPALQIPCGFSSVGMPIGMQIMGKPFAEADLLGVGAAYEAATDFVGRIAPIGG